MFADQENRLSRRDPRQPQLTGLAQPGDVKAFARPAAVNQRTGEVTQ
jgi:hypothetical protein